MRSARLESGTVQSPTDPQKKKDPTRLGGFDGEFRVGSKGYQWGSFSGRQADCSVDSDPSVAYACPIRTSALPADVTCSSEPPSSATSGRTESERSE